MLKGRSNYLCRQRLVEMEQAGRQATFEDVRPTPAGERRTSAAPDHGTPSHQPLPIGDQVARLAEWSATTATGDRAELDFEPHPTAWSSVSVGSDECPGAHRCPSGADCFTELARARAARADVVVVNLHLLGADLASGGAILPEHDALVVDEAHELEDVLAACLGADVSPGRFRGLAVAARSALGGASTGRRRGGRAVPTEPPPAAPRREAAARRRWRR